MPIISSIGTPGEGRELLEITNDFNEQTLAYTAVLADRGKVIHYTGAGGVDLDFTAAATLGQGWNVTVRNDAVSDISLNPAGGELINGAATLELEGGQSVIVVCSGTEFFTSALMGANTSLSNLSSTQINEDLTPGIDLNFALGTDTKRWSDAYLGKIKTGQIAADTTEIQAFDTVGLTSDTFITLTAGNPPTCNLADGVTCTTQAPADNSTKIATTAYADAVGVGAGALVYIATATAAASATVNFDNNLSATYDNYLIVGENIVSATNDVNLQVHVGVGAGPTYSAVTYQGATMATTSNNGGDPASSGTSSTSAFTMTDSALQGGTISNVSTNAASLNLTISNTQSATNYKSFISSVGGRLCYVDSVPYSGIVCGGGSWNTATALTSLRLSMSSGNTTTGTFRLYGIKNS